MRLTTRERWALYARINAPWRRLAPRRTVTRQVQGVDLTLPWFHRLPDYAAIRPQYGQNLVQLARLLQHGADPLQVLDIGANAGDSSAQILAAVDARILCVEADPFWIDYLERNVRGDRRVVIEAALLTEVDDRWSGASAVRTGGTTRFEQRADGDAALRSVSVEALRARHEAFHGLRLVKSDTDGFDPYLVPAVAKTWAPSNPVLFFEFDPVLARRVDTRDPFQVWTRLRELGYTHLALWDNAGDPVGQLGIDEAAGLAGAFDRSVDERGFHFLDVAACTTDDEIARAAFDHLVPQQYRLAGTPGTGR